MENKNIEIISKVKEVEVKSGAPLEIDITDVFKLAERGRAIKDVNDPEFPIVKREMQKARKVITEYFKEARDEFNRMSKGIIEVQNTVLGEFTPEEDRLIAMDKAEKERLIKEARLEALPAKHERITTAGLEFTDEEILGMEDADFELEFARRVSAKAEADRVAAEAKLAEERAAFEKEKEEAEAKAKAKADEEEAERVAEANKILNTRREILIAIGFTNIADGLALTTQTLEDSFTNEEIRMMSESEFLQRADDCRKYVEADKAAALKVAEEAAALKAKQEAEEAEAKRVADVEAQKIADQKAMEEEEAKQKATKKWQTFLTENNYDPETDTVIGSKLYRLVATYTE